MSEAARKSSFPTTRWSVIFRSKGADAAEGKQATDEICRIYWPPIYVFLRGSGHSQHDAEDLTQGFFEQLLIRGGFDRSDPSKGKLRSYLLGALKHYVSSERRKTTRVKRGGKKVTIPWNDLEAESMSPPELTDGLSPEKIYTRSWVTSLLGQVLDQLDSRYSSDGKGALFNALKPTLTPGAATEPYASLAVQLGMSESAVKVAAYRLRQRFRLLLCDTVAFTLMPDEDIDQEISELMAAFD